MIATDLAYEHSGRQMDGRFFAPEGAGGLPSVLVIHGAHGLTGFIEEKSAALAQAGYAVLAIDLWGGRKQLSDPSEIGAHIGALKADPADWMARIDAARQALAARPEVDATRIGALGYCMGGSSVIEFIRTGGALKAGVTFHAGLDLVADGWAGKGAPVLICTGAADPMATDRDLARITAQMTEVAQPWEANIYGGVLHAFTEPDAAGRPPFARYNADADRRSWAAMLSFFKENLI